MKYNITLRTNQLPTKTIEQMWAVYNNYYHYTKENFLERFNRNNFYALYFSGNKLIGFTGLRIHRIGKQRCIYFGQTVIDKSHRGKSLIVKTGFILLKKYHRDFLSGRVWFWADALSYKAYLVFAKTLSEYYPNYQAETPGKIKQLRDIIGTKNYKDSYQPKEGIVLKKQYVLYDNSIIISPRDLADEDVRFFAQANPGHQYGNGLLTIAPANLKNLLFMAKNVLKKSLPHFKVFKKIKNENQKNNHAAPSHSVAHSIFPIKQFNESFGQYDH